MTRSSASPGSVRPGPLRHEEGLDGVRAVLLAMALLTHSGFSWAPGGFVGVSGFFTMSGFLITTLLLRPPPSRGELSRFWVRRFRRLLPAAFLLVIGVLVLTLVVDLGASRADLRGDATATLLYYANWHFLLTGSTYDEIFTAPSPFHHMWSLSIEEQFYLVFPLVMFGLRWTGMSVRRIGWVMLASWVASVVANLWIGAVWGVDATYLSTPARLSEILVGAALATLWPGLLDRDRPRPVSARVRRWVLGAALAGSAVIVALFLTVRDSDPVMARGVLPLVSLASVAAVAGILVVPAFSRAVSLGPLPVIGRMSYGIYLFHWPIFIWLSPTRTGLDPYPLLAVRVALAVALASLSYRFVESPMRDAGSPTRDRGVRVLAATGVVALVALMLAPVAGSVSVVESAEAELETLISTSEDPAGTARSAPVTDPQAGGPAEPGPAGPLTVAMFGDSTAFFTQLGLARWANDNPSVMSMVEGSTKIGCPIGRAGFRDFDRGEVAPGPECDWTRRWPTVVREHRPDVAILQAGPWEVADYRSGPGDPWIRIGESAYDAHLLAEFEAATDALLQGASQVILLTSPAVEVGRLDLKRTNGAVRASQAERMDLYNQMLVDVSASRDRVSVVDLAAHVADISDERVDPDILPDGLHFSGDSAERVVQWLGPAIVDTVGELSGS